MDQDIMQVIVEINERKLRERNIIVYGTQELDSSITMDRVKHDEDILRNILDTGICGDESRTRPIMRVRRLGKHNLRGQCL